MIGWYDGHMQGKGFEKRLSVGGKSNSLGKVDEVVKEILGNREFLVALYDCMFSDDAWVRMRAADAFEKVCRVHPDWIKPYIHRLQSELSASTQPSIQWHIAQIYSQVSLQNSQKKQALDWLRKLLSTNEVDWIAAANAMDTLAAFVTRGDFAASEFIRLLKIQQTHKSKSVVRKADKHLDIVTHS